MFYKNNLWSCTFKALSHGAIFHATCNAILLLVDVKLANTSFHHSLAKYFYIPNICHKFTSLKIAPCDRAINIIRGCVNTHTFNHRFENKLQQISVSFLSIMPVCNRLFQVVLMLSL